MPRNSMNLFIAMATSVLFIIIVLPINAFDDSLLLYLPFDHDTGGIARDLTGKTGGGKIIGGTKIVQGKRGRALQLDGESGYVEIGLTPEMIGAERDYFTAELWLMTTAKAPRVPRLLLAASTGILSSVDMAPMDTTKGIGRCSSFRTLAGTTNFDLPQSMYL